MDKIQLNQVLYKLLNEYRNNHIYCFFASNLFKHLTSLTDEQKRQIIRLLLDCVKKGILFQRYIIFNPYNPRERKIYNSIDDIPVNEEIEFDFENVYISSLNDPQIKVFYEIVDKSEKVSEIGIREESSFFNFEGKEAPDYYDSLPVQITINTYKEETKMTENNFNINNSNINQVAGTINNDNKVTYNNTLDQDKTKAIMNLSETNNQRVNDEIEELKKSTKEKNVSNIIKHLKNIKEIYSTMTMVMPGAIKAVCMMFGL